MELIWIILIIVGFWLIYSPLDSFHDVQGLFNLRATVKAERSKEKKEYSKQALKYNKRQHTVDAVIKGFVGIVVAGAFVLMGGFEWYWILILTFAGLSLRWLLFDLSWNFFAKQPLLYSGSVSKMDGVSKNKYLMLGVKIALICLSAGIIYWVYNS